MTFPCKPTWGIFHVRLSDFACALSLSLPPDSVLIPFSVPGIDLENIVYYKDDTHYFVMTAKKKSLLEKGVIKQVRTTRVWFHLQGNTSGMKQRGRRSSWRGSLADAASLIRCDLCVCRTSVMQRICWLLQTWTASLCVFTPTMPPTSPQVENCLTSSSLRTTQGSQTSPCLTSPACTVRNTPLWSERGGGRSC